MSDWKLIKWIYALIVLAFVQEKTANIFGAAICSPPCLLFTNRREIVALDYKTSTTHSVVSGLTNAIAIDVHFSLGYIFWSDVSEQNIKRSAIDGSSVTTIITNVGVCDGLAVEWRTSQLYWTDTTNDKISVSDLSGNNQKQLLSLGLDEPRDIALDPDQGLMIWTDWGTNPKIEKATLSGNQRVALVTSNLHWPNGIELDRGNKRIFWVDGGVDRIESVDYQGNNRKLLLKITGFHPFGVALIPPFLFFTDWVARSFLHKLDADTGDYLISDYITSRLPTGIVAYDSSRQPPVSNQCAVNNGGCSHFCVVTSSGHVCVCPGGLAVKQDGRTCEDKLKKFLLFTDADDKSTNMISLDVNYFYGKILIRLGNQRPIALDFDPVEDRVYWTDVKQGLIRSAFYNATSLKILFRCNVNVPDGLAIDKVGRNIYWSDTGTDRIEVARLDGTKRKVLIKDGLDEPRAIVLDERNGIMYWTDWGSNPKIEKADMDGASRRSIVTGNLGWPNGLTMDQTTNLLYWADAKLDKIEVSDLNGGNRRLILSSAADIHPFGLTVYQGMLYWTDWNNKSITRLDLSIGKREMIITGLKKPMDIHLYDSSVASGSHPCATNNGLCSDLCLLKPHGGYQCACPTGIGLKPDGKTCDYDTFYRKSSDQYMLFAEANAAEIYKVSLAVPDTPCEPLEIRNNISRPVAVDYDPVEGKVYWTDVTLEQISRAYPNGSDLEVIAKDNVMTPDGVAVDWIGRNLYWTDAGTSKIEVSLLDGSFRTTLVTINVDSPRAIILDIEARKMYWSDWGYSPKIEQANMDGTARTTLVSSGLAWVNSLALDFKNKLLYWCDALFDKIEKVDLQGNNRVLILRLTSATYHHPFSLALYEDALFWSDWSTKSIHKYNMTSSISEVLIRGMGRPMEIHIYDSRTIATGSTSCSNLNGGCSHLCLPNPTGHRCFCPEGVQLKPGDQFTCQGVNRCPQLFAPAHGSLKPCINVPGQTCQFSCDKGYLLSGTSVRTCKNDGAWTGIQTQCTAVTCPALPEPSNGVRQGCTGTITETYNTVCQFSCFPGFNDIGSSTRRCLENGSWSGQNFICQANSCPTLVTPPKATLLTPACTNVYGSSCLYSCQPGYTSSSGNVTRVCSSSGKWTGNDINCTDSQSPSFGVSCPQGPFVAYAEQGNFSALVNWTEPVATDNSGVAPTVTSNYQSPQRFNQGTHVITYTAVDQTGNMASCTITVKVIVINCTSLKVSPGGPLRMSSCSNHYGSQCNFSCPVGYRMNGSSIVTCVAPGNRPPGSWNNPLPSCEDIQPPTFIVPCPGKSLLAYADQDKFSALVNWTKPVAIDNSGVTPSVTSNYQSPQRFSQDTHVITYTAVDQSGNRATCSFNVEVSVINCTLLMIDPGSPSRMGSCGNHYGSKCNFSCAIGYRLNGSSTVTCVAPGNKPPAFWDNPVPSCQVISCPQLITPPRATLLTVPCFSTYGSNCSFSCQIGFTSSSGNVTRTCLSSGQWSGNDINCKDSQPPSFGVSCPGSPLLAYAERDKFTALVNWTEPVATDNSGVAPTVTSNYQSPQRFSQGTHVITYTAVDQSGNNATCKFQVQVIVINCTLLVIDSRGRLRMSSCGNNYGSKCNFSCAIGYRLNGSSTVTCVAPDNRPPGLWDNPVPSCQVISCPQMITPPRATLLTVPCPSTYGSNCSFSCQTGYTSSYGNVTRTCLSSGQWSGNDINCTDTQPPSFGASCPGSPLLAYAERDKFTALVNWTEPVATDNSGVAPTVTPNYQSPQRFSEGTHVITYTAVDKSGNNASCTFQVHVLVINCTLLVIDPGGPLRMSSCGNYYGSKCNFSCAIGYRLHGSSTVICVAPGNRPPGVWDNAAPLCQDSLPPSFGVSCPGSPLLAYAERDKFTALVNWTEPVAADNSGVAPTVTSNYQSPQRFSQGTHVITYTAVDQLGNTATCTFEVKVLVINCTLLVVDSGSHLRMSSCGNHYGSKCNFSCATGYRLNGSSTVTCVAPGNKPPGFWDNPVPSCQVISCPPLVTPPRATLSTVGCPNTYGSNCSFSCQTGYTSSSGNVTRTCLSSGQWSGNDIICTDSQPPTFGVSCPGSLIIAYAEQHKFTALVNWTEPVATDNSGVAPTVTSNYQSPQRFNQGTHVITYTAMDQSRNNATCTFQVQVLVINCTLLMVDSGSPLRMSSCGNHYGSMCNFSCVIGYKLNGSSTLTCVAPGNRPPGLWDNPVPSCQVINCPTMVTPPRATLLTVPCPSTYGSNCSFSCQTGYTSSSGNVTRTCLSSGQWSGNDINCTDSQPPSFGVSCPGSPLLAYAERDKFTALANWTEPVATDNSGAAPTVTSNYLSPQRFNQGTHVITYTAVDQSGNSATCTFQVQVLVINCTLLVIDSRGPLRMSSCGNHYGSKCNFSCAIGYRLNGSSTITCVASGNRPPALWDNPVPSCQVINCQTMVTPPRATLLTVPCSSIYGSNCSFSCQTGYTSSSGNVTRTCLSSGQWSGNDINCTDSQPPSFGVSCPASPLLAYAEREKFSALVNWNEPVATDNSGVRPTMTSNYQSPQRFSQGTHVITYTAVDQLGNTATCTFTVNVIVINCTSLVVDPGGPLRVSSCGNHYGSQCNFSCDIGYRLNGSSTVTCAALSNRPPGFWDKPVPTCQGIKCLSLPAPTHGVKSGCSDPLHERYGTICRFSCNVGYNLTGSSRRQCQENETWTGITPACRVINCSGLMPPANGAVDPSSCLSRSTYGQKCTFSCSKTGYILEGTSTRVCEHDGAWTGENNTLCRDKMTPSFNNTCPKNMAFYVPKCSSTALVSWNEPIATDNSGHVIISYPAVRSPANLSIGLYNVHYSATDDEGNTANCTFIVQIARKSCPVLQPPTDGTVTSLSCGSSYGSRALLSCNEGYRLAGSRVRSCQEDRKWSGNVTTCNIISCPQMITPPRATLLTVPCSSTYGSNCSFSCQTGYASSSGNVTRACMSSGQWSGNDINCKDIQPPTFVSCPEQPLLRYAERDKFTALVNWTTPVVTDNSGVAPTVTSNYGSPQKFSQGTHAITYIAVDQSGNKATCTFTVKVTVINCTTLTVGLGGPLHISSCGNHYGEMCHFSCDVGYRMNGLSTVTCMARDNNPPGFWNNPLPICQEIRCASLSTPANGLKAGCSDPVSERYGTICSLSCKIGYNMTGSSRRQCLQNETWSGHKTACEDIQPPSIQCPPNMTVPTDTGQSYAVVTWKVPVPTDNSNEPLNRSGLLPPQHLNVGQTPIRYDVTDSTGLNSSCAFLIHVKDLEAPTINPCPRDIKIISQQISYKLVLPAVTVADNVGVDSFTTKPPNGSEVTWGEYNITYTALDKAGNKADCKFRITIADTHCEDLPAPLNGAKACETRLANALVCTVHCNPGYGFATQPHEIYYCSFEGKWFNVDTQGTKKPALPDCSKKFKAKAWVNGEYHYLTNKCGGEQMNEEIAQNFIDLLYSFTHGGDICRDNEGVCEIQNVKVQCGKQTRRRRDTTATIPLIVTFELKVPLSNSSNSSLDLNQTSLQISNDILAALQKVDMSMNVTGVVIVEDTTRPPEIRLTRLVCDEGQVQRGTICVNCPVGYSFIDTRCQPCAVDRYQDREGQTSCISCPSGTSTFGQQGSKRQQDCQALPSNKSEETKQGLSKTMLIIIAVGAVVLIVLIIVGISCAWKYYRGPKSKPDSESSPVGFANQAYDDTDWKESVTFQDLMYSSDA